MWVNKGFGNSEIHRNLNLGFFRKKFTKLKVRCHIILSNFFFTTFVYFFINTAKTWCTIVPGHRNCSKVREPGSCPKISCPSTFLIKVGYTKFINPYFNRTGLARLVRIVRMSYTDHDRTDIAKVRIPANIVFPFFTVEGTWKYHSGIEVRAKLSYFVIAQLFYLLKIGQLNFNMVFFGPNYAPVIIVIFIISFIIRPPWSKFNRYFVFVKVIFIV